MTMRLPLDASTQSVLSPFTLLTLKPFRCRFIHLNWGMARYLTRRYAAVSWAEALRLSLLDNTPISQIRDEIEVNLIHRTEWWAWWSDLRLTTAIGLPEDLNPSGISPDAEALISAIWESDSPAPQCGWPTLARVQQVLEQEVLLRAQSKDRYRSDMWEALTVVFTDGEIGLFYRLWSGFEEGYYCEIRTDLPELPP